MDIDAGPSPEATPFLDLLADFKLNNKHITIDELTNIINNLDPSLQVFKVEGKYADDFRKLVLKELEERVELLFIEITDKIIDKKNPLVSQAIADWKKDTANIAHITKIGTFKINLNFEYKDKMLVSQKVKSVSITYGELLTKYNIFKNAIQTAFAQSSLIKSQSEFIKVFYKNAITTLNMRVSTARDLFDTAGVSAQCEAAHKIDWPSTIIPVPKRFTTTYPEDKTDWNKYCYICGFPINNKYGEPSQCEHILPVFQACTFNCLIQVSTDINAASALRKALYKLEYAGSHACCNILKSNNSFITIDPTQDTPIRINFKYIKELISLITKSKNQSASLECFKLLAELEESKISDFIDARAKEIKDDYVTPLVEGLNETLKLNKSNGEYATSGIISLFLLLNQFISFEPAIEQTIIGILAGGTMIEKFHKLFLSYATATFITDDLEPIISNLEQKGQSKDDENYLDIIGFIDKDGVDASGNPYNPRYNPSYDELLKRLLEENYTTKNIILPRNIPRNTDYKFFSIKDLMSHLAKFYINKNFLNTNNYDDFVQMTKVASYMKEKYPYNIASCTLEIKIKIFFSTLLKQFYPYNATQSSFSAKEKLSLLEFCKAYIGLEFVYIIIYFQHDYHKKSQKVGLLGEQVEFFTDEVIAKINTCCANYKEYYMEFVTYFFIYQSIHILYTSNFNSLTLDQADGTETETEKKKTIIDHSGETYYDILELLSKHTEYKVWLTDTIASFIDTIENRGIEAIPSKQLELKTITDSVLKIKPEVFKIFMNLFDTDAKFKKILTIYNVDSIGSAAFRKKIIKLPDKPSIGFVAAMPNAGINYAPPPPPPPPPAAMSQAPDGINYASAILDTDADADADADADMPPVSMQQDGGIPDRTTLQRQYMTKRQGSFDDRRKQERSDKMITKRGIVDANTIEQKTELEQFIRELQKIEKIDIIDEFKTRSSRSETIYELRPSPPQLLQNNLGQKILRLVINDTQGIHICIYSPAIILTIYRCILIDTKFVPKIVEMIKSKYVFSNGELLDDTDIQLLEELIHIQADKPGLGRQVYYKLCSESTFFTQHPEYLPLFEKCNLFLYYDSADNSVRDIYDNKLYASHGGPILGGKKYYKKITKKLKNKKIIKKTKEKLKTKSRKHKSRKHKSRKHKSNLTKTLKKKI